MSPYQPNTSQSIDQQPMSVVHLPQIIVTNMKIDYPFLVAEVDMLCIFPVFKLEQLNWKWLI